MIKAVLFDLDGTLIDSTDAIVQCFMHTFDTLDEARPPRERVVNTIGFTLEQQFAMMSTNAVETCARIYREEYRKVACAMTTLLPGAHEALADLSAAGLKLGFATSKRREFAEMILDHLGVLHYFASRIGPDDVSQPKPHPEAVLKSLEGLGVSREELFFVGDTAFDVKAAQAAEVRCVAVTTGYDSREKLLALGPEAVFDSLEEATQYMLDELAVMAGETPTPP